MQTDPDNLLARQEKKKSVKHSYPTECSRQLLNTKNDEKC